LTLFTFEARPLLALAVRTRYFFVLVTRINPHQSPIRIKAIVIQALRLSTTAPGFIATPQRFIGSIPCPMGFSQILWLLANPLLVHGIGESSCPKKFQSLIGSRQRPIKPDGFATNPFNGSLPGPNRCSFQKNLVHIFFLSFRVSFFGVPQLPITPCGFNQPL
jgi:hypothetical protein